MENDLAIELENTSWPKPIVRHILSIWKSSMIHPFKFFSELPATKALKRPLIYGLVCQSLALLLVWAFKSGMEAVNHADLGSAYFWSGIGITFIASVVIVPVTAIAALFIMATISHATLRLIGGPSSGYSKTVQVVCYSSSAQILALIPVVGTFLAGTYSLILNIIGLKKAHGTSYPRAIAAILIPMLLITTVIVAIVVWMWGRGI